MSGVGQPRHFDRGPALSDLPRSSDIVRPPRHVGLVSKTDVVRRGAVGPLNPRKQTSRCLTARVRNGPQTASRASAAAALPDGSLQIVMRGVKEDPSDPTV